MLTLAKTMDPPCNIDPGDTTWVLLSTVLVLTMMPALAFFEAGLLRTKNSLSVVSQVFCGIIVLSVLWVIFGYSLSFGKDHGGIIGDFNKALFIDGGFCLQMEPVLPPNVVMFDASLIV